MAHMRPMPMRRTAAGMMDQAKKVSASAAAAFTAAQHCPSLSYELDECDPDEDYDPEEDPRPRISHAAMIANNIIHAEQERRDRIRQTAMNRLEESMDAAASAAAAVAEAAKLPREKAKRRCVR